MIVAVGRMPRGAAMAFLLRAELIKLRTTRTAIGFFLALLGLTLAKVLTFILVGDPETIGDKRTTLAGGPAVVTLLVAFGVVGAAGEHRHGTITPTLLAAPDRRRALLAKLGAYLVAGTFVGALLEGVAFAVGVPLLADAHGPDLARADYVNLGVGGALSAGGAAMIGVSVGALVRSQVGAVIGVLAYLLVIEPLISDVVDDVYPWTLGGSMSALGGITFDQSRPWGESGLVLLGWAVALCVVAFVVDRRRDVA